MKIDFRLVLLVVIVLTLAACAAQGNDASTVTSVELDNGVETDAPTEKPETPTLSKDSEEIPKGTIASPPVDLTQGPSFDFSVTATPVPPLESHTWNPDWVLISWKDFPGDSGFQADPPPRFVLYADGTLVWTPIPETGEYQPMQATLSAQEICNLLNTIDQTGFFDFDKRSLNTSELGSSGTRVEVNSWNTNFFSYSSFWKFAACLNLGVSEPCGGFIPESTGWQAVVDTYNLLSTYGPQNADPYIPEKVVVYIFPWEDYDPTKGKPWPLDSITLSALMDQSECGPLGQYTILELDLKDYPTWLEQVKIDTYYDENVLATVYSRPLFPYEALASCDQWSGAGPLVLPDPNIPPPDFTLTCSPEDGVLPIPQIDLPTPTP